jgi:hypothetical protein
MNTKAKASDLTQQDFGGDCDTPPEPWPAIWVAWNSEDGFSFWKHQNQAALWSAADSNEWPVQYSMQKAQPAQQRWAVFCGGCRKEWSVPYQHPGKSICAECETKCKDAPPAQPAPEKGQP